MSSGDFVVCVIEIIVDNVFGDHVEPEKIQPDFIVLCRPCLRG